jgi:hypothetical protein
MSQEPTREEKAFEGLIVQTLVQAEKEEYCLEGIREPNEKERSALRMVKSGFLKRLFRGDVASSKGEALDHEDVACVGDAGGQALYRCEGVDHKVEAELEKADREIIERRKKELNG